MTKENPALHLPPQRRPGWAPPPSHTAPTPTESAPRIRVDVPYFNGVDPMGWIFKIQKYFDYFYTSDKDRLNLVCIVITDPAAKWFRSYLCTNVGATWMDFLLAVKQRFDPDHFEEPESALNELVPQPPQTDTTTEGSEAAGLPEVHVAATADIHPCHESVALDSEKDTSSLHQNLEEFHIPDTDGQTVLPDSSRTHDVMPVSLLRPYVTGSSPSPVGNLTDTLLQGGPVSVLMQESAQRTVLAHDESQDQWRITWSDDPPDTWEPVTVIRQHFPQVHLEDKVIFEGGGVDTYVPTSLTADRTPRIRQQPTRYAEYVT